MTSPPGPYVGAGGSSGGPSYGSSANPWNAALSSYNWKAGKAATTRNIRRALSKAAYAGSGSVADIVFFGDSLLVGWNGAAYQDSASVPRSFATELSLLLGLPIVGTGVVPAVAGGSSGVPSDRWSSTGSVDFGTGFSGLLVMFAGSTVTYTSLITGTVAQVYYGDTATGSFTWQVDGGAVNTVNTGSTNTVKLTTQTGLPNTVHAIKITSGAGNPNIYAVGVDTPGAQGLRIHNLSLGGTTASVGGAVQNWNDTTNYYGFGLSRRACLTAAGITPALAVCSIGGNDLTAGSPVASIMAGITSMRGFWPASGGTDFLKIVNYGSLATANELSYLTQTYSLADSLNISLLDWQDRIGDLATAIADGDIGADNVHPTYASQTAFGRNLAELVST